MSSCCEGEWAKRTVTPRCRGLLGSFESCEHGIFARAGVVARRLCGSFGRDLSFIEVVVRDEGVTVTAAVMVATA